MKLIQLIPTRSAWAHLRFVFSIFLLPVYLFAFSQAGDIRPLPAILIFVIWHMLAFPASNGYNSYFDRDQNSIALLAKPPQVDISLYYFSIALEGVAFLLAFLVSWEFALAVLLYGIMSKLYSHPAVRLKKYPVVSFLVVFFFQGAFVYYSTYSALCRVSLVRHWDTSFIVAGAICSCLIGASYPLTQIYQHEEDRRRGDKTISIVLGYKGSFIFSGLLFALGIGLSYLYWHEAGMMLNFYFFLVCALPIFLFFNFWFYKVGQSIAHANFKNAMRMNFLSSACMLIYFGVLALTG